MLCKPAGWIWQASSWLGLGDEVRSLLDSLEHHEYPRRWLSFVYKSASEVDLYVDKSRRTATAVFNSADGSESLAWLTLSLEQHDFSRSRRNTSNVLVYLPELLALTSMKYNFTIGDLKF